MTDRRTNTCKTCTSSFVGGNNSNLGRILHRCIVISKNRWVTYLNCLTPLHATTPAIYGPSLPYIVEIYRLEASRTRCWLSPIINKCIGDDTKAAACQRLHYIKNKNKIKYGEKRFLIWRWNSTPCNVAWSLLIITLISSGDCTLQCGMWLWNRDSKFTEWQHPAMWYMALGWHATEFAQTHAILEFYIWFRFRPHHRSRHVAPVSEMLAESDHRRQKKITSCRFSRWRISAILDFRNPIMGSLKAHVRLPIGRQ